MSAHEVIEVIFQYLIMSFDVPGYVLNLPKLCERCPAGKDDVHQHEDFLCRCVNEDVASQMVLAFIFQLKSLVANTKTVVFLEGHLRHGPVGVIDRSQELCSILMRYGGDLVIDIEDRTTDMVSMGMAVDEVCNR